MFKPRVYFLPKVPWPSHASGHEFHFFYGYRSCITVAQDQLHVWARTGWRRWTWSLSVVLIWPLARRGLVSETRQSCARRPLAAQRPWRSAAWCSCWPIQPYQIDCISFKQTDRARAHMRKTTYELYQLVAFGRKPRGQNWQSYKSAVSFVNFHRSV